MITPSVKALNVTREKVALYLNLRMELKEKSGRMVKEGLRMRDAGSVGQGLEITKDLVGNAKGWVENDVKELETCLSDILKASDAESESIKNQMDLFLVKGAFTHFIERVSQIEDHLKMVQVLNISSWLQSLTLESFREASVILSSWSQQKEALLLTIHKEHIHQIIGKLHIDYAASETGSPSSSPMGRRRIPPANKSNAYTFELAKRFKYLSRELVSSMTDPSQRHRWAFTLSIYTIRIFLLHASLLKPVTERVKLTLTNDLTQVEFALNQFGIDHGFRLNRDAPFHYYALKNFRSLLFMSTKQFYESHMKHTQSLDKMVFACHGLGREGKRLPNEILGMGKEEFVKAVVEDEEFEGTALGAVVNEGESGDMVDLIGMLIGGKVGN